MSRKALTLIGSFTYLLLLAMAFVFYKERIAFTDAAYHLFYIVKDSNFAFQNHRYIAFFTQAFPLFAVKLGLPLAIVAKAYSLSFILLYFTVFLLLILGFKNQKLALAWLLFCVLMPRFSFYWCLSEVYQGAAFYFLYLGFLLKILEGKKYRIVTNIFLYGLLFFITLAHPLMPFLMGFVWLFFWIKYPSQFNIFVPHVLFFLAIYLAKTFLFNTQNDYVSTGNLIKGLKLFPNYFNNTASKNFVWWSLFDYYFVSVFLLVVLWFYAKQKKYVQLVLVAFFYAGYAFMNNISEPFGLVQFYIESRYIFLSAFVLFPLVFDVLPQWKWEQKSSFIILPIVLICLLLIYNKHDYFSRRVAANRDLIAFSEKSGNLKPILFLADLPKELHDLDWGVSYETWIISTIENKHTISILTEAYLSEYEKATTTKQMLWTKWENIEYRKLPAQYFVFTDTNHTYKRERIAQQN